MKNRRWGKRFQAELRARFGLGDYTDIAIVQDVSFFGFFLVTPNVYCEDTLLKIQMMIHDGQFAHIEGRVQWSKQRPPNITWQTRDAGMGIKIERFLAGREHYENICHKLCRVESTANPTSTPLVLSRTYKKNGFFKNLLRF